MALQLGHRVASPASVQQKRDYLEMAPLCNGSALVPALPAVRVCRLRVGRASDKPRESGADVASGRTSAGNSVVAVYAAR